MYHISSSSPQIYNCHLIYCNMCQCRIIVCNYKYTAKSVDVTQEVWNWTTIVDATLQSLVKYLCFQIAHRIRQRSRWVSVEGIVLRAGDVCHGAGSIPPSTPLLPSVVPRWHENTHCHCVCHLHQGTNYRLLPSLSVASFRADICTFIVLWLWLETIKNYGDW